MLNGCISWVKACTDFFGDVTVPEFQALTAQDKADLHELLTSEGYELHPLVIKVEDNALVNAA